MRTTIISCLATLAAVLLAFSASPKIMAQDGYDQQQWWNPGDWFDDQPQYNLFSDRYWNDTYGGYHDTDDLGSYDTFDYDDYGDGTYDPWDAGEEYGYDDTWDYGESEWGLSDESWTDSWDEDETAIGAAGEYESGFGYESEE
ncbi:MAG: hypothetical protein AB9869_00505 [Verrucomicrobiia bacterium]